LVKPRHELRRRLCAVEWTLFSGAPGTAAEVEAALAPLALAVDGGDPGEAVARVKALAKVAGTPAAARDAYVAQYGVAGVRRFDARKGGGGALLYLLQVETFPDHVNNVYLIVDGARVTLYDCGSQTATSREDLLRAEAVLGAVYRAPAGLDDATDVIISHAHIDHFGGVGAFRARGCRVHAHTFDARVISRFEERIITAAMQVRVFLERAGVSAELRAELEQMYVFGKSLFTSVPVDRVLEDGEEVHGHRVVHVPGHCPGQICLLVEEVLLTTDHVLPRITPHQSPESITPWTGLDHYFRSLERVRALKGVTLGLPGHEEPIRDLGGRIEEIEAFHRRRLDEVLALCGEGPQTLAELALRLFGEQQGYGRLLALEEAAAHTEYLQRRGQLEVANLDHLLTTPNPALRYRTPRTRE
jgi:glyoxylase-like metal-dependent hydrolase (beta-lactamase superfamily II)